MPAAPSAATIPETYDSLESLIAARYERLSRRLRQVAEYAVAHPDDIALETIAVIAGRAGVPPSSLIRFAKAFGFDGFSDMQRLFRARLVERAPNYGDRLRRSRPVAEDAPRSASLVLDQFAQAAGDALERLRHEMPAERLEQAVEILAEARAIYVVAQRRAFAVASYLAYLLGQLGRRTHLLDGVGGMLEQQARGIGPDDALLAVSFRSYAPEVVDLVERCHRADVPVVAITDGPLSPLVRFSAVSLEVVEAEVQAFRSLSASMCLTLALAVALGHRLRMAPDEAGRRGDRHR